MTVFTEKITKTYLRTEETMERYMKEREEKKAKGIEDNPFEYGNRRILHEFKHWYVIDNDYAYDAIASTNHMIATIRDVKFDWDLLNEDELAELAELRKTFIKDNYDVLFENLPSGQTIPGKFHLHLLVLKRD